MSDMSGNLRSVSRWRLPDQLEGRSLLAARGAWLTTTIALTLLVAIGFVRAFESPSLIALPALVDVFTTLGLNLRLMMVVALVAPFSVVVVLGLIVFWRRSRDPMALLFTMALLSMFALSSRSLLTYEDDVLLRHSVSVVFAIATVLLALVLGLFPDGRFVPRSSGWLPPAVIGFVVMFPDGGELLMAVLDGEIEVGIRVGGMVLVWSGLLLAGLAAQFYRFRHVSGPTERQQTKWVVVPLASIFVTFVVVLAAPVVAPGLSDRWLGWGLLIVVPLGLLFAAMVANAVLRYRLYEIDRVIRRTVSYALVVSVLGLVYGVTVLGLGSAVSAFTGQDGSDLVVAGSVLAVIGLFRPVRTRVQRAVDRQFNRTGFEARAAVDAFGDRLRDEVSLEAICDELAATAKVAVQPSQVSVWLAGGGTASQVVEPDSSVTPR